MTLFNPTTQTKICGNDERCHFGDFPTLAALKVAYGEQTPTMWLIPQLYDLSEFCGCKDKLRPSQLEQCASLIAMEFYHLKISELMLFFYRFKVGRYGTFYGAVDPMVIMSSLRKFLIERNDSIDAHEKKIYQEKMEGERKHAITWEEYCLKHKGEVVPNPLSGESVIGSDIQERKPQENSLEAIKMARWLIEEPNESIRDAHSRAFEKKYGCTPQEYLAQHE